MQILDLTREKSAGHLRAGAKRVILSVPPKDDTPMYVFGVNSAAYAGEAIISAASCTTNCLAPVAVGRVRGVPDLRACARHGLRRHLRRHEGGFRGQTGGPHRYGPTGATILDMDRSIRERRGKILSTLDAHGARNPPIFGSVASEKGQPSSDIDVLVDMDSGRNLLD